MLYRRAAQAGAAATPEEFNAQLAAAVDQAQQKAANTPGMRPKMRDQMQAAMAQGIRRLGGTAPGNTGSPGISMFRTRAAPGWEAEQR